jgi:transposase-like protein
VPLCIVHLIRNGLRYVSWKDRKAVVAAPKPIYQAALPSDGQDRSKLEGREIGIEQAADLRWRMDRS